jgi:DNA-binding MarR family transcriptional regulator
VDGHLNFTEAEVSEALDDFVKRGLLEVTRTEASGKKWYRFIVPVEEVQEALRRLDNDHDLAD